MTIHLVLILIIGHWLSDFIFQTTEDTFNKTNKNILSIHSLEYSTLISVIVGINMLAGIIVTDKWYYIIGFFISTFILHYIIDYLTSKLSKIYWDKKDRFGYFSTIITDQLVHLILLFLTVHYLFYV